MNIIEAVNIIEHSPSVVANKLKSFIYGFNNRREVNYFDLFLFYPLFTYKPSYEYFNRNMLLQKQNQMNFFVLHSSAHSEIFASFKKDYILTLPTIREAILYGVNNNYFQIDENFRISLVKKTIKSKDRVAENIGKFYSCQSTAYLYDFFKVDIDAI